VPCSINAANGQKPGEGDLVGFSAIIFLDMVRQNRSEAAMKRRRVGATFAVIVGPVNRS
jgi:hypothetical protein